MSFITITNENVNEVKERETVVVEFWAPWCGYCKRLAPVLKQVAKEHAEAFDILQINIDEFETLMNLKHWQKPMALKPYRHLLSYIMERRKML